MTQHDDALNNIAETRYTDPLKAERMMADLNETYQDRLRQIDRVSNETFEQEMDEVVAQAPRAATDARIARYIQRVKDQMREYRQTHAEALKKKRMLRDARPAPKKEEQYAPRSAV